MPGDVVSRQYRDVFPKVRVVRVTVDFGSTAASAIGTSAAVTIQGAAVGDVVTVTPVAAVATGFFTGTVTAANTVVLFYNNNAAGTVDLASQSFNVILERPKVV